MQVVSTSFVVFSWKFNKAGQSHILSREAVKVAAGFSVPLFDVTCISRIFHFAGVQQSFPWPFFRYSALEAIKYHVTKWFLPSALQHLGARHYERDVWHLHLYVGDNILLLPWVYYVSEYWQESLFVRNITDLRLSACFMWSQNRKDTL